MILHSWTTFVCECGVGFQVESINAIGLMRARIKCPLCQSSNIKVPNPVRGISSDIYLPEEE